MTVFGYLFVLILVGIIGYNVYKLVLQIKTLIKNRRDINNKKGGNAD